MIEIVQCWTIEIIQCVLEMSGVGRRWLTSFSWHWLKPDDPCVKVISSQGVNWIIQCWMIPVPWGHLSSPEPQSRELPAGWKSMTLPSGAGGSLLSAGSPQQGWFHMDQGDSPPQVIL